MQTSQFSILSGCGIQRLILTPSSDARLSAAVFVLELNLLVRLGIEFDRLYTIQVYLHQHLDWPNMSAHQVSSSGSD